MSWKIVAIIFIILFILETFGVILIYKVGYDEIKKDEICVFEICKDYPEAYRENNVCYCYDYDTLGELNIVTTEYMK